MSKVPLRCELSKYKGFKHRLLGIRLYDLPSRYDNTQHTLSSDSTCMACHPNMTLNRYVSAAQFPTRLARPPREPRGKLPQALILVGFSKIQCRQRFWLPDWPLAQACPRFIRGFPVVKTASISDTLHAPLLCNITVDTRGRRL